jgi:hypothetical protein
MLTGRQRRVRRVEARALRKSAGDVSRWIERVEDRVLLAGSDSFSGRTNLGSVASVTDTGSNVGFTGEGGEPAQSGTISSAWWTWIAPANGTLVVDTIGSNFDTFLTLATGSTVNALTVIAQDDDGGGGLVSGITATVTSGTAYHFAVDGFDSETGSITLNLNFASLGTEDYGDAPTAAQSGFASSYPTLLADNGARHTPIAGFSLGSSVDTEGDGQPSSIANLDDATGTPDDEDGVTLNGTLTIGNSGSFSVFVTNTASVSNPYLDAWIDYNRDGDWADSGEQIFSGVVVAGANTLNFVVPAGAAAGQTFSRFRLHGGTTGLAVTGLFANGDVEDHVVNIATPGIWTAQGPAPAQNGQVENITNREVVGAIHTVVAHPANANILYVGSTNGGVWKSIDATTAAPTWTPLTDSFSSLSIGAMQLDPTDVTNQTLVAGVGRYSSFGRQGGARTGLLKTTDGGSSWTPLDGGGTLVGKNISGIAARGNTIVASVNNADSFTFGNIGIFRSSDGGATFTRMSVGDGSGATGLPEGASYDLASDPANNAVLYTSIVFNPTATKNGIYKSTDTGATWSKVSDAAINALVSNNTSNLEIAVGTSNNVYAAVINNGNPAGIFRSGNGGVTWIQMDTPQTNENGTNVGLNPRGTKGPGPGSPPEEIAGGQGSIHFSIIADPSNANIVYVGGDRQPRTFGDTGGFPNSIGANDFTGRLFRGNAAAVAGSQWVHLTHSNSLGAVGGGTASSSAPHADSREMTFDANGNLIEVDDGGIYRRTSPLNSTGDWFSINGNLQVTESHDVAYDSLSNIIMSGNQDTGTTEQISAGSQTWRSVTTGDGGDVAVDNITLAGSNRSIRYSSFQNFQQFRRRIVDSNNVVVSTAFPALTVTGGSPAFVAQFDTPIVLNSVNPSRIILGGSNGLYESTNQGDTITRVTAAVIPPDLTSNPIAYGGRSGGIDNPEVIYAGANNGNIHIRTTAGGAFTSTDPDAASSDSIRDVRLDPDQWQTAFAIDINQVFTTTTIGAAWNDITGNLPSGSVLRSLEFISAAVDAVVVGTNFGVFVSLVTSLGTWVQFGNGLPNIPVWDMHYDLADNVLVIGTLGRGIWTLANASAQLPGQAATDDFGDAPSAAQSGFASSYPVTLAENGALHTATGPRLGANRDSEADGIHSALADADDTTGAPDDEDGVTISSAIIASKLAAVTGAVTVNLQNAGGVSNRLDAWIDFNRDGDWNDSGEQIFSNFSLGVTNGAQVLNFSIPQDTGSNVEQGTSHARFRVSTAGGLGVAGAAADGEVEDYQITIASSAAFVVDTILDESDGNFAAGDFSLREAIELANAHAGPDEIQFAPGLSGNTITLTVGQLLVTDDLTITGLGAANLTVSGGNSFRVFDLQSNPDVLISGLTISGGLTTGVVQLGAAFRSTGNLELIDSVVTNNSTTGSQSGGAGIFQGASGTLRLTNSAISDNTAPNFFSPGGGIYSQGEVIITASRIEGNSTGGQFGAGAGIFVAGTT